MLETVEGWLDEAAAIALAGLLPRPAAGCARGGTGATGGDLPLPEAWKPTTEELDQILLHHRHWEETASHLEAAGSSHQGRANLCNADLSRAKLNKANLRRAKLNKANLSEAELNEADLSRAELNKAKLYAAKLNKADLTEAELNEADLRQAELNEAMMLLAELNAANLFHAKLNKANLSLAKLNKANLQWAELSQAVIQYSSLDGAQLAYADLTHAIYSPNSAPPNSFVAGIQGLETVIFPPGEEVGLIQFRELLQKAGLRDLERETTFAIEHGKTAHALDAWRGQPLKAAEGIFRTVVFDWTTAYGLRPAQALLLIVALWVLLIPVYWWPIWRRPEAASGSSSIFQIYPKDRIDLRFTSGSGSSASAVGSPACNRAALPWRQPVGCAPSQGPSRS
jgi:uncharacterized protein YjbI with pentapeptide repeats